MSLSKALLTLVSVGLFSTSVFAVKPDGAGAKGADKKQAAADARLCREQVREQFKALPKGKDGVDQRKALIDQLKACNPHGKQ